MTSKYEVAESALSIVVREVDEKYLRPDADAVREAKRRAETLIDELHRGRAWMYRVLQVHGHGSLSRGTALRHFKDLDRLIELDPVALRTRVGRFRTARDTIGRMALNIAERRAGMVSMGALNVRPQDHSVGIEYPGGLRIDLVPAVRSDGLLHIPEQETGNWIVTDPDATAARLARAKRAAPHAGIAVRLLKGWARARGRNAPMPSFAIETWVVEQVLLRPLSLDELVAGFWHEVAAANVARRLALGLSRKVEGAITLIDPVSGNNLTQSLERHHRVALIASCRDACKSLLELERLAKAGRHSLAVKAAVPLFVGRWK